MEIDLDSLSEQLAQMGYQRVSTVEDRGSFAIRGGIVDIFPPLHPWPPRRLPILPAQNMWRPDSKR